MGFLTKLSKCLADAQVLDLADAQVTEILVIYDKMYCLIADLMIRVQLSYRKA